MFTWLDPGPLSDGDLELVLLRRYPGDPGRGYVPAYVFKMVHPGEEEELGRIELRVGDTEYLLLYGGHIGYWVAPQRRGHHYAARACKLLLPLARRHGMKEVWITCDPDNIASRRTCELVGATLVEIVDLPEDSDMYREGSRQKCRYRIDLAIWTGGTMTEQSKGIHVDPTADIHPTVLLEGNVTIGAFTRIDAGTIITGNVTIGHHTLIRCNVVIRGRNRIGNYTHIYDAVCIEGGRPAQVGTSTAEVPDQSIIGDDCWINHGATMHGTQMGDGSAVGLNACCDYDTRLGKGAVLANGSATHHGQVIPDNCFAEGVPAKVVKEGITDEDRRAYFGLIPRGWTHYEGDRIEADIRKKRGL